MVEPKKRKKTGKYAGVMHKLTGKAPPEDVAYQGLVDLAKTAIIGKFQDDDVPLSGARLADVYAQKRRVVDALKHQLSQEQLELEAITQLMTTQFEEEGMTRVVLHDGASVGVREEPHATVVDKIALRKWAIKHKLENELTLPWPTVNSLSKELLLAGQPEPDGVKLYPRTVVELRKPKGPGDFEDIPSGDVPFESF